MANEFTDALNPLVDSIKKEIGEVNAKVEAHVNQLNEDAKKKGETLGELSEKVNRVLAEGNRLKSNIEDSARRDMSRQDLMV